MGAIKKVATFVAAAVAASGGAEAERPDPSAHADSTLSIRLIPHVTHGQVDGIGVTETFTVGTVPADGSLLSLPIVAESVPGVLQDPAGLVARDDAGALPLDHWDDPVDPTGEKQDRHWRARRAPSGRVTVSYTARPRTISPDTKPAALLDMRTEGAGIYGSTRVLFAVPEGDWPREVRIAWDLSAMPTGSRAMWSFGEGDTASKLDRRSFGEGFFMAGPWSKIAPGGNAGFQVYYLTPPETDLLAAAQDVEVTYKYASRFFGTPVGSFRVLMRTTDRFQGGGNGGYASFIFGAVKGDPRRLDDLKNLLSHEMLHNWIGNLSHGPEGLWFVEGATNYYEAIMPYRAGRRTLEQVQTLIDDWTRNYYANPRRLMSDDAAAALFWSDDDAQSLPYSRGPLYIALVDARMRKASGGRRRVDELVRAMTEAERQGTATEALWLTLVTQALGDQGRRDFEDMKAGRMLELPDDLFGPCFVRKIGPLRRYVASFAMDITNGRHLVRSVRTGSNAAAGGLVKGDEIVNWQVLADAKQHPDTPVILRVRGLAGAHDVTFLPGGPAQSGSSWIATSLPPADCRL